MLVTTTLAWEGIARRRRAPRRWCCAVNVDGDVAATASRHLSRSHSSMQPRGWIISEGLRINDRVGE